MKCSLVLFLLVLLLGCGISGSNSDEIKNENLILKARIDSLTAELNDLKFGSENTLKEAMIKIKEKRFIESKSLLSTIIHKYPSSKEFATAKQLLNSVNLKAEDQSFSIASHSNDKDLLRHYIIEYPRGKHISQANKLVRTFQNNIQSPKPPVRSTIYQKKKAKESTVRVGAMCCDGTRSYATGRGACSHHGGVCEWLYE